MMRATVLCDASFGRGAIFGGSGCDPLGGMGRLVFAGSGVLTRLAGLRDGTVERSGRRGLMGVIASR